MAQTLVMPKLGLTMTEGTIGRWFKSVGDHISVGEAIYEVETDKITNSVEATLEGTLLKIIVEAGGKVPCMEPVAIIGEPGEAIEDLAPVAAAAEAPKETAAPAAAAKPADAPTRPAGSVLASPAAKKRAKELGLDIGAITGTGPKGRITLEDVEQFAAAPTPKASPLAAKIAADKGVDLADIPADGRIMAKDVSDHLSRAATGQREEVVPMSAMRRVIAKRMSESAHTSPTVTLDISVDMSALIALKGQLAATDIKVSYTDMLVKMTGVALRAFPLLNCSVDGDNLIMKHYVNIGVAVALENGLVVPVIKDADQKRFTEISTEIRALAAQARAGTLGPDALSGGTFTITNLGMYGIESFTPIINQPEVAILGVNAIVDTLVLVDGQPVAIPKMKLSLTTDHRAVDGAVAAQFLARLKSFIEKPALLLA